MGTGTSRDKDGRSRTVADDVPVPDVVRLALLEVAARTLGALDPANVPAPLQRVRRFAPRRRAGAGAVPLWQALTQDKGFRHAVTATWSAEHPEDARALDRDLAPSSGEDGPRAPGESGMPGGSGTSDVAVGERAAAVRLAVGAFLARPEGWREQLEGLARELDAEAAGRREHAELERLRRAHEQAAGEIAAARQEADRLRAELAEVREQATALRRAERSLRADADRARAEARAERERARADLEAAREAFAEAEAARRAAATDLERARAERDEARATRQVGADLANARAKLLLDAVVDAAVGLRRELALPPASLRPADLVDPGGGDAGRGTTSRPGSRGRGPDDPALLDDLLSVPQTHLVVDGYNVSKTGFGDLPLADQRRRLVDGLVRVATRTGAEVTCCFDGSDDDAARPAPSRTAPGRGVRVRFSSGEIADDLIRRIVAAEPQGRPVVVVTSDRAVADDAQAMGAVVVGSGALLARLAKL